MQIRQPAQRPVPQMPVRSDAQIRIGQLNAYNLFDTVDSPSTQEPVRVRAEYRHHLGKLALAIRDAIGAPDIITLQEVENAKVLSDLVARPELKGLGYKPLLREGTDPRGIDTAILYRDTVTPLDVMQIDPQPLNDAARAAHLFTRPPLMARFAINGQQDAERGVKELTVISTHLTSKLGGEKAAAKRGAQAELLAKFATGLQAANPKAAIVMSGDFNMEHNEPEFAPLRNSRRGAALVSATREVPLKDRYTWRDGRKHLQLDHMLMSKGLAKRLIDVQIPHLATQMEKGTPSDPLRAEGVSDHDPIVATIAL